MSQKFRCVKCKSEDVMAWDENFNLYCGKHVPNDRQIYFGDFYHFITEE